MFKKWRSDKSSKSKPQKKASAKSQTRVRAKDKPRSSSHSSIAHSLGSSSFDHTTTNTNVSTTTTDGTEIPASQSLDKTSSGTGLADSVDPKAEVSHLEFSAYKDEPYDPSLEYKVINKDDSNMPYGDGSDKVFGMENFGYTCYIASILQALYFTEPLRKEVLSFPKRDPENLRKRKLRVKGIRPHGFMAAISLQQEKHEKDKDKDKDKEKEKVKQIEKPLLFAVADDLSKKSSNSSVSGSSRMKNLFSRSSSNEKINNADGSSAEDTGTSDGTNDANGNSPSIADEIPVENIQLERTLISRYPSYKDLDIRYFLNHQSNVTIVGATNNSADGSEQRKRRALFKGPIINLDISFSEEYGMKSSLFTSLKDAFEAVTENSSKVGILSPYYFVEVVKQLNEMFRSSMHQDAHEFLNFLINSLIEVVSDYTASHSDESSKLSQIFEGLLTSETKCLSCESISTRDEKFLDLSIDLQQNTSIANCLKMFSQSEMLKGSDKFFCETCHSLQEAAKMIKLKKLPQILAFHLKRFKYSEELGRMVKLFYRVEYTKTLRIFNTTDDTKEPDKLYELYSVVVHIGGGPYHGHYVSLIKTNRYGWLLFDDETVESIDENYVYRFFGDGPGLSTAYLLFYREVLEEEKLREKQLFNGLDDEEDSENFGTAPTMMKNSNNTSSRSENANESTNNSSDTKSSNTVINGSEENSKQSKKKNRLTLNFMKL
ncbi:hypothetical protein FOA43_003543 [Brettanomyces nanus]|uniref:ubiquitinyl hydrolase 1 n=1 Tax=Eeniella nana TaxID=13502 RepID=A0A875RW91_EENNA|nr:uncharacterized protein FOA43_003543 [Brettanomyces nanus]QPG76157.1 hypothetical protein FOA43_003543 [Brettanomyces nanus]